MAQPIVYVDTSAIRDGKLAELEVAMKHLAAFVDTNVPHLISYAFYRDEARSRMTVVAVHPDSTSRCPWTTSSHLSEPVRDHPNQVALPLSETHLGAFEDLCRRFDVTGDLVPDAYIAAIAVEQGCAVASFDRDFARFDDLDWVVPGADR